MSDWRKEVKKDSPLLYHFDIEGNTPLTVTIEGWDTHEAFCPGKGEKGVLWCLKFKGAKKALGINITNGELIERATGSADKDTWKGKQIILRVANCKGEKCIRVHAPKGTKLPKKCPQYRYLDADPDAAKPAPEPDNATPADQVEAML